MKNKEVEQLLDCSKCKLTECIGCDITYTDRKKIKEYIEELEKMVELMAEIFYKRFKAELLLEYGFENEEQLKQYFVELVEKETKET